MLVGAAGAGPASALGGAGLGAAAGDRGRGRAGLAPGGAGPAAGAPGAGGAGARAPAGAATRGGTASPLDGVESGMQRTAPYSALATIALGLSALFCVPLPWWWAYNLSARTEIPMSASLEVHLPALFMSVLAAIGVGTAVLQARYSAAALGAASVIPVLATVLLGSAASDGVLAGATLLAVTSSLQWFSQRRHARLAARSPAT